MKHNVNYSIKNVIEQMIRPRTDTRVTVWRAREATIISQIFMGNLLRLEQESRWWQDASLEGLERNPDEPNHGRILEDDLV